MPINPNEGVVLRFAHLEHDNDTRRIANQLQLQFAVALPLVFDQGYVIVDGHVLLGQHAQALAVIRVHSFYLHRGHVHLGTPAKHCGAKQYSHKTTANEQIHTHQYKLFLRLGTTFRHISDKRPFLRIKGQKPNNSYGESFTQRTGKASSALLVSQPSTYAKPADSGDPLLSGVQKSVNDPTK